MIRDDHALGEKTILIAESDNESFQKIQAVLLKAGIQNTKRVPDGPKLLQSLREFYARLGDLGLLIINNRLDDCSFVDICNSVSRLEEHSRIPMIVLVDNLEDSSSIIPSCCRDNAIEIVAMSHLDTMLASLARMSLHLKRERDIRRDQAESLIEELSERKVMEAKLKYLVSHDELTGISNRRSLEKTLELSIHHCRNFNRGGALLYLDLDNFNVINDIEGHRAGDQLLVSVVKEIRQEIDPEHHLARIGADEFCILLEGEELDDAKMLAERLRVRLDDHHFVTGEKSYHISASIGVAALKRSEQINLPSELIARAHQACYIAKTNGRNKVHTYNKKDTATHKLRDDVYWVPIIRDALSKNRFQLSYQPIVRLSDGEVSHYEVLLRMLGEGGQIITPDQFIPVAERMGLIHHLDLWVVENAIDFLANLPASQSHVSLAVNLSTFAFQDEALLPLIKQKLESTWVSASRLTFEITETAAINNYEQTRDLVSRIRALGCHFALDDFGAGFSSFNYLKNFPVDYLKIDGQFIRNLIDDETDQVLVKSMVDIAKSLGKRTIAEYVESVEVARLLKDFGIDYVQGYLLGRPQAEVLDKEDKKLRDVMEQLPGTVHLFSN